MEFNLKSKQPISLQLMEQIKRYIALGILAPDEKLPSVRELAEDLSINPNTVSKVYLELEEEGVLYSLNKKGYYVTKREKCDVELLDFKQYVRELIKKGYDAQTLIEVIKERGDKE